MNLDRHLAKSVSKSLLATSFVLSIITITPPTFAQFIRYTPPPRQPAPTSTSMGGVRGGSCAGTGDITFTALAPTGHIGQTSATHPTFVWYVPDRQSFAIDFQLYVYGADGKPQRPAVYQTTLSSTSGMMQFTLPATEPELLVGQHYYWQAALICDPNHGSEDLIIGAEMQVVATTVPESERWYDLFNAALDDRTQVQPISRLLQDLATLERSSSEELAGLADAATGDNQADLVDRSQIVLQHSQQLSQISEIAL